MKISLQVTMQEEAKFVIGKLGLKPVDNFKSSFPHNVFAGKVANHEVTLMENGRYADNNNVSYIGTEAAAIATQLLIDQTQPELLINAGTAGGRSQLGANIGDVYLAKEVYFHDHRVSLPGYHDKFPGGFKPSLLINQFDLPKAIVTSGNSFDLNSEDLKIIEHYHSEAKEMELAAIAWVCELNKVPWLGVKSITDLIDTEHASADQFFQNFNVACENLAGAVFQILQNIES